jgi:hypothetical protein
LPDSLNLDHVSPAYGQLLLLWSFFLGSWLLTHQHQLLFNYCYTLNILTHFAKEKWHTSHTTQNYT